MGDVVLVGPACTYLDVVVAVGGCREGLEGWVDCRAGEGLGFDQGRTG